MHYIHGSKDSLDVDVHLVVDRPMTKVEGKALCDGSPFGNANAIYIEDGVVVWSYKGSPDETNNGLFRTYCLHQQQFPLLVTRTVPRVVGIKAVRTIRGMLGMFTRSQLRPAIKAALHNPNIHEKIEVLRTFRPSTLDVGDRDWHDSYKFLAFQLAQTISLFEDGEELFTKRECATKYPELRQFLDRDACVHIPDMDAFWFRCLDIIAAESKHISKDVVMIRAQAISTLTEKRATAS